MLLLPLLSPASPVATGPRAGSGTFAVVAAVHGRDRRAVFQKERRLMGASFILSRGIYFLGGHMIEYSLMSDSENNQTTSLAEELIQEKTMDPMLLEEMVKAGILYGRKKSKTHPRMRPFIYATRSGIEILDLPKTMEAIDKAGEFLKEVSKKSGLVLAVGTKPATQDLVENFAQVLSMPFVVKRWLGGTLTNFKTLSKRISYFKKLKSDKESGRLDKYTKKERLEFDRQIAKLSHFFSGLETMETLPQIIFVVDVSSHLTAVREAKRTKIPVVGILNTDTDPALVDYPILANDRAKAGIDWILARLEKAVEEGRTYDNSHPKT
jgi:small subunit ribosomal protein S2